MEKLCCTAQRVDSYIIHLCLTNISLEERAVDSCWMKRGAFDDNEWPPFFFMEYLTGIKPWAYFFISSLDSKPEPYIVFSVCGLGSWKLWKFLSLFLSLPKNLYKNWSDIRLGLGYSSVGICLMLFIWFDWKNRFLAGGQREEEYILVISYPKYIKPVWFFTDHLVEYYLSSLPVCKVGFPFALWKQGTTGDPHEEWGVVLTFFEHMVFT